MSLAQRRGMVDREHLSLSITRQCALLGVARSSLYYRPREAAGEDLALMQAMDRQYLDTPFYGSRRMKVWLAREGRCVSRKRVQRLMRIMGLRAIYRSPRTSRPAPEHRVYPYLLERIRVTRPNQAWAADITCLPMARGFLYLVAITDWHSRYVVAWRLSNTLEADFCVDALREALGQGQPEVFNTDQGRQFTSLEFTQLLQEHGVKISVDGKGRWVLIHPQEALLQQARALQQSAGYDEYRARRVVVEHRLARLVHLGIRQSRYFGRVKTRFQLHLAATVANLTLVAGRLGLSARTGGGSSSCGTARHRGHTFRL